MGAIVHLDIVPQVSSGILLICTTFVQAEVRKDNFCFRWYILPGCKIRFVKITPLMKQPRHVNNQHRPGDSLACT